MSITEPRGSPVYAERHFDSLRSEPKNWRSKSSPEPRKIFALVEEKVGFLRDRPAKHILEKLTNITEEGIVMFSLIQEMKVQGLISNTIDETNYSTILRGYASPDGIITWERLKHFLQRYGPLFESVKMIQDFVNDGAKQWFHGPITSREAEQILKVQYENKNRDVYLVRERDPIAKSEYRNYYKTFTISSYTKTYDGPAHVYVWQTLKREFVYVSDTGKEEFFLNIKAIVDHIGLGDAFPVSSPNYERLTEPLEQQQEDAQITKHAPKPLYLGNFPRHRERDNPLLQRGFEIECPEVDQEAEIRQLDREEKSHLPILGKGGGGIVYLVKLKNELVALKMVSIGSGTGMKQMLQYHHENIMMCKELFTLTAPTGGEVFYLVMELLDYDLFHMMHTPRKAEYSIMCRWENYGQDIALGIIRGLEYLHNHFGFIHKDIKSPNIFIKQTSDPAKPLVAKLGDLDSARKQEPEHITTYRRMSYNWCSPEQATGKPISIACDIFSFGVILWEIISQGKLWVGKNEPYIYSMAQRGSFYMEHEASIPNQFWETPLPGIIKRCTAKEPQDRMTASEVVRELENILHIK